MNQEFNVAEMNQLASALTNCNDLKKVIDEYGFDAALEALVGDELKRVFGLDELNTEIVQESLTTAIVRAIDNVIKMITKLFAKVWNAAIEIIDFFVNPSGNKSRPKLWNPTKEQIEQYRLVQFDAFTPQQQDEYDSIFEDLNEAMRLAFGTPSFKMRWEVLENRLRDMASKYKLFKFDAKKATIQLNVTQKKMFPVEFNALSPAEYDAERTEWIKTIRMDFLEPIKNHNSEMARTLKEIQQDPDTHVTPEELNFVIKISSLLQSIVHSMMHYIWRDQGTLDQMLNWLENGKTDVSYSPRYIGIFKKIAA